MRFTCTQWTINNKQHSCVTSGCPPADKYYRASVNFMASRGLAQWFHIFTVVCNGQLSAYFEWSLGISHKSCSIYLMTPKMRQNIARSNTNDGDAMTTACIRMYCHALWNQTIKYPMQILCILRICRWWQIILSFQIYSEIIMVTAALHFSLRSTTCSFKYFAVTSNS